MLDRPFRFTIGSYWILLPHSAQVSAEVKPPSAGAYQTAYTTWIVSLARFQLFIHLNANADLDGLKAIIDYTTKSNVITPSITINGISGVTHGDYGPPRTWIDWWFKKGDLTICLNLQSVELPYTEPTQEERAEHNAIICSIKYSRDFPSELPPTPRSLPD